MASPPPLQQPPLSQLPSPSEDSSHRATPLSSLSFAYNPNVIIAAILAFVFLASTSIHLFLHFLSRSSSNSCSSSSAMQPLIHHHRSSSATADLPVLFDEEKAVLIESLPLFSLASSIVVLPKSSPDCAVCLSPSTPMTSSASFPPATTLSTPPALTPGFDPPFLALFATPPSPSPPCPSSCLRW